jgi:hypothetical protein
MLGAFPGVGLTRQAAERRDPTPERRETRSWSLGVIMSSPADKDMRLAAAPTPHATLAAVSVKEGRPSNSITHPLKRATQRQRRCLFAFCDSRGDQGTWLVLASRGALSAPQGSNRHATSEDRLGDGEGPPRVCCRAVAAMKLAYHLAQPLRTARS